MHILKERECIVRNRKYRNKKRTCLTNSSYIVILNFLLVYTFSIILFSTRFLIVTFLSIQAYSTLFKNHRYIINNHHITEIYKKRHFPLTPLSHIIISSRGVSYFFFFFPSHKQCSKLANPNNLRHYMSNILTQSTILCI